MQYAVSMVEEFADGAVTGADVSAAGAEAQFAVANMSDLGHRGESSWAWKQRTLASVLAVLVQSCPVGSGPRAVGANVRRVLSRLAPYKVAHRTVQAALVRDIAGNPFRPVAFDTAWRTPTAAAVALAIYDNHAFHDLPVLADALEDAGCDAAELLAHYRDASLTHARGCWAVDLVLGRA